ncbi:MAG: hypothetical protein ABI146_02945, partial [Nitrobacter sp.]
MNGPLQIAQADTSGTGGTKQQPRIVKVTKPYGDQSVVVPLSYDGSVKADLSAIASEKITLVHVGEKLIILFDNHSTITLEPFFDSTGKPLQDLTVEVAPGRDITSAEFATLFPVTDDQSVLPAAGTGNGGGRRHPAPISRPSASTRWRWAIRFPCWARKNCPDSRSTICWRRTIPALP